VTRLDLPLRPAALTCLALGLTFGLSACSSTNAMTTVSNDSVTDGVRFELGDVVVSNLMVVTAGQGRTGTVLGAVSNHGTDDAEVTIGQGTGSDGTSFTVGGGDTVLLGLEDGQQVDLDSVSAPPGGLLELSVVSDRAGATTVRVPVMDGTLPEYADLVPGASD
jgi:hypothetical protein